MHAAEARQNVVLDQMEHTQPRDLPTIWTPLDKIRQAIVAAQIKEQKLRGISRLRVHTES